MIRPALRGATIFGGASGAVSASLARHEGIAVGTLVTAVAAIAGNLWIAKRRDDLFRNVAAKSEADPAILRELTIHEAVRAGLLSSEDTVRLLRAEPEEPSILYPPRKSAGTGRGPARVTAATARVGPSDDNRSPDRSHKS